MVGENWIPEEKLTLFYTLPTEKTKKGKGVTICTYTGECAHKETNSKEMHSIFL